jgi:hypothetical protein
MRWTRWTTLEKGFVGFFEGFGVRLHAGDVLLGGRDFGGGWHAITDLLGEVVLDTGRLNWSSELDHFVGGVLPSEHNNCGDAGSYQGQEGEDESGERKRKREVVHTLRNFASW